MKLILIRHWETENNVKQISTWHANIWLTEKGIEQTHQAGQALVDQNIDIDLIYSSTLIRARQTADIIKSIIWTTWWDINTSDLMTERDLWLQTNQPRENRVRITQLPEKEKQKEMIKLHIESDESLDSRIKQFMDILDKSNKENILLIWHRWWFRRLLSKVLSKNISENDLKNWSITIVDL